MLRLFKIEDSIEPMYFDNKRLAKRKRDQMADETPPRTVTVRRGPDHRKGETFDGAHIHGTHTGRF